MKCRRICLKNDTVALQGSVLLRTDTHKKKSKKAVHMKSSKSYQSMRHESDNFCAKLLTIKFEITFQPGRVQSPSIRTPRNRKKSIKIEKRKITQKSQSTEDEKL